MTAMHPAMMSVLARQTEGYLQAATRVDGFFRTVSTSPSPRPTRDILVEINGAVATLVVAAVGGEDAAEPHLRKIHAFFLELEELFPTVPETELEILQRVQAWHDENPDEEGGE